MLQLDRTRLWQAYQEGVLLRQPTHHAQCLGYQPDQGGTRPAGTTRHTITSAPTLTIANRSTQSTSRSTGMLLEVVPLLSFLWRRGARLLTKSRCFAATLPLFSTLTGALPRIRPNDRYSSLISIQGTLSTTISLPQHLRMARSSFGRFRRASPCSQMLRRSPTLRLSASCPATQGKQYRDH